MLKSLFVLNKFEYELSDGNVLFKGNEKWIKYMNNLFSDIKNMSISDDENNRFLFTNELLANYFYKDARLEIHKLFLRYSIKDDKSFISKFESIEFMIDFIDLIKTFSLLAQ